MKQCSTCGKWKEEGEFREKKNQCKKCRAEYNRKCRETHKEQETEYHRKWCETHREQMIEYRRKYRETHKEQETEYHRKWCETHREQKREYSRKYGETHREQKRKWCEAHRDIESSKKYFRKNGVRIKDVPPELLKAKALHILVRRKIKELEG